MTQTATRKPPPVHEVFPSPGRIYHVNRLACTPRSIAEMAYREQLKGDKKALAQQYASAILQANKKSVTDWTAAKLVGKRIKIPSLAEIAAYRKEHKQDKAPVGVVPKPGARTSGKASTRDKVDALFKKVEALNKYMAGKTTEVQRWNRIKSLGDVFHDFCWWTVTIKATSGESYDKVLPGYDVKRRKQDGRYYNDDIKGAEDSIAAYHKEVERRAEEIIGSLKTRSLTERHELWLQLGQLITSEGLVSGRWVMTRMTTLFHALGNSKIGQKYLAAAFQAFVRHHKVDRGILPKVVNEWDEFFLKLGEAAKYADSGKKGVEEVEGRADKAKKLWLKLGSDPERNRFWTALNLMAVKLTNFWSTKDPLQPGLADTLTTFLRKKYYGWKIAWSPLRKRSSKSLQILSSFRKKRREARRILPYVKALEEIDELTDRRIEYLKVDLETKEHDAVHGKMEKSSAWAARFAWFEAGLALLNTVLVVRQALYGPLEERKKNRLLAGKALATLLTAALNVWKAQRTFALSHKAEAEARCSSARGRRPGKRTPTRRTARRSSTSRPTIDQHAGASKERQRHQGGRNMTQLEKPRRPGHRSSRPSNLPDGS